MFVEARPENYRAPEERYVYAQRFGGAICVRSALRKSGMFVEERPDNHLAPEERYVC